MDWAAQRASDACLAAVRQYMRALVYFREGEYRIGQRLLAAGHDVIAQEPDSREALAVAGQLHLGGSVIAARAEEQPVVEQHISEARQIAQRTGDVSDVHWLSFGPTNVVLHKMSAAVEMCHYDEALKQARNIKLPSQLPTSRRAHFLIDQARAEVETGHTDAALKSLTEARRLAPEQTRYHPAARETITGLVHQTRRTPETLNHMTAWIGL
jgi:UTP:GlnB (protein PII) uridylyltransferase